MENKQKPKTLNVELIYYMFDEIKSELREFKKDYVTKAESSALKQEIHALRTEFITHKVDTARELKEIKGRKQAKDTILWVGLVASALINIIAIYNAFTKGHI